MTDYNSLTDEQLVELCRNDNDLAWSVILERYTAVARKKAGLIGGCALESDDLVQEGLIGLFSAVHSFDSKKKVSFSTYANVCIRNSILNAVNSSNSRKNLLSSNFEEDENDFVDTSMTPEELAISKNEIEFMQSLILKILSEKERQVFLLFLSGESYGAIAEKLDMTTKGVDGALQRARLKLRNALSQ